MTSTSRTAPLRASVGVDRLLLALAVTVFCIALTLQSMHPGVADVSWLLVVGERVLDGARLYVDIIEVNPPASLFLYLPAVWLGRVTGVAAEWFVLAMTTLTFLVSAWSVRAILHAAGLSPRPGVAALAAVVAFVLLPGESFAQREHFAVLFIVPALALIVARMEGAHAKGVVAPGVSSAFLAGVAAGAAVCIKPQFGVALLLPQLYAAWRVRSLSPLLHLENWSALAVVVAYVAATAVWFPAFFSDMLPLVTQAYRPQRQPAWILLFILAHIAAPTAAYLVLRPALMRTAAVPLLAALGFALAYIEQGKGWPYHLLPAACLLVAVVLVDAMRPRADETPHDDRLLARALPPLAAALLTIGGMSLYQWSWADTRDLDAGVRAAGPAPRILTLSGDIALGHPLTRRVGGQWVGVNAAQWITVNTHGMEKRSMPDAALARLVAWDRELFLKGFRQAPDVLLVDTSDGRDFWKPWLRDDPEIARLLEDYVLERSTNTVDLYVRKR